MSQITSYTTLQSNVASWLNRADLTSVIPTFIQLAEAKLRRRFKDVTPLSSTVADNWLLLEHPDAYLYGSLLEAAPYLKDDPRVQLWGSLFQSTLAEIRRPDTATAIDTYAGLKDSIADWLNRPDLDDAIPRFIQMAEASLARDPRIRDVTCRGSFQFTGDGVTLPDDYKSLDSWYHDGPNHFGQIRITTAEQLSNYKRQYGETGVPRFAAILDNRIYFAPVPDAAYNTRMAYYRKVTPLATAPGNVNWLLQDHPDVYLYASLAEAAPYLGDDNRVVLWRAELERRLEDMNESISNAQFSGSMRTLTTGFGA